VLGVASVANAASAATRGALLVGAAAAIALMLRRDRKAAVRLFPAKMLSLRGRGGKGFWMIFCVAICTTPGGVYLPLLLQVLHGLPPAAAGYLYAAQSLSWTAAALVGARLSGGSASRAVILGPVMIGVGFAGLLLTLAAGPMTAITLSVILVGAGIGACWGHVGSIVLGPDAKARARRPRPHPDHPDLRGVTRRRAVRHHRQRGRALHGRHPDGGGHRGRLALRRVPPGAAGRADHRHAPPRHRGTRWRPA
jgi:hypothetical protein